MQKAAAKVVATKAVTKPQGTARAARTPTSDTLSSSYHCLQDVCLYDLQQILFKFNKKHGNPYRLEGRSQYELARVVGHCLGKEMDSRIKGTTRATLCFIHPQSNEHGCFIVSLNFYMYVERCL